MVIIVFISKENAQIHCKTLETVVLKIAHIKTLRFLKHFAPFPAMAP